MTQRKSGLGKKNLDVFLSKTHVVAKKKSSIAEGTCVVSIDRISPDPQQPRRQFTTETVASLASSIEHQGLIQPIIVKPLLDNTYQIIAGERRWRAAKQAGLTELPVVIKQDVDERRQLVMALVENLQREDLNVIDEALGFARLIEDFSLTHQAVADMMGRSRTAVTNSLRLLQLHATVQELLIERRLDMGHARALLGLSPENQLLWASKIIEQQLSVRDTESAIQASKVKSQSSAVSSNVPEGFNDSEKGSMQQRQQRLAQKLTQLVSIKAAKQGTYRVQITCNSIDDLDTLIQQITASSE